MEVLGDPTPLPEADGFPSWLLVRDDEDGRRAQVEYADYWYRSTMHGGPNSPHRAVVGVQEVRTTPEGATTLRLGYARPFQGAAHWLVVTDRHGGVVLRLTSDEGADINGRFCWVEDPLQAPIPSWGEVGEAQPWRK